MLGLRDALSTYENQKVTAVVAAVTWRKHTGHGAGNASLARQGEGSDSVSAFGAKELGIKRLGSEGRSLWHLVKTVQTCDIAPYDMPSDWKCHSAMISFNTRSDGLQPRSQQGCGKD